VIIEKVNEPIKLKDDLLKFVFGVYQSTNGAYPALEWAEKKPEPNDFEGFKKIYEPFLEFRLTKEFDELYVAKDNNNIIGTVALVYNLKGKEVWWVPEELREKNIGLIEFFMVDEKYRGKRIGSKLLTFAIKRLKELGKEIYIVTFPHLPAYQYYLKKGFQKVMDYKEFVILKFKNS